MGSLEPVLHARGIAAGQPLRVAIFNQVNFHTHVVAGSMKVLQAMTSAPVTVYLPEAVLKGNWYGFMDWLGKRTDIDWRLCTRYEQDTAEQYDIVWFISPEWDIKLTERVVQTLKPRMVLLYLHNGHMPLEDLNSLRILSPDLPLLTMAPHVAKYIQQQLDQHLLAAGANKAEWMIPTHKYQPGGEGLCDLEQQQQGGSRSLEGYSITGSIDKSLRNYAGMWEQIRSYKTQQGADGTARFKLKILGEVVQDFVVPEDLQEFVAVYRTPPDPVFYDVIYHSYGLLPALANPQYYVSKLTSAAITSLMTGVPIIADDKFLQAYSMMEPATVFRQHPHESELDVMFRVATMPQEEIWATRAAVQQLQRKMNTRAISLVLRWILDKGLIPDQQSAVGGIL